MELAIELIFTIITFSIFVCIISSPFLELMLKKEEEDDILDNFKN